VIVEDGYSGLLAGFGASWVDGDLQNTFLTVEVFLPRIPTVSKELAYATTPHRESNPYEGLNPTVPVYAAGSRTEPPVSVPRALRHDSLQSTSVFI
jgi:hypothetical protein